MLQLMKSLIFFSILILFSMSACSVAEQDASGVGQQVQNGIHGRGTIVPNSPTSDSFGADYR